MVYVLLGIGGVICALLLCTLTKSKKTTPPRDWESFRNTQPQDAEFDDLKADPVPEKKDDPPRQESRTTSSGHAPVEYAPVVSKPVSFTDPEDAPQAEVCDMESVAFAEKFLQKSFMDNALRDEFRRYKGKFVNWNGTLRVAYPFQSDLVFGNRSGTRATFHLCEIPDQYGMRSTVTCVVAFDRDAADTLKPLIGKAISFRAKLVNVNSTTREIVLDEATLV